jgi:hypothetical protein
MAIAGPMRRFLLFSMLLGVGLLAWPRAASAQVSIWLQKGVSGAGAAAVVAHNEDQNTFGVNGGYSHDGWLEFDLTAAYITFPENESLPADLDGLALSPHVEVHPLKQGEGMPVSLGVTAGFTSFFLSSEELDDRNASLKSWNISADASVYRFFKLAPNLGVTPAAGITFIHSSATFSQFGNDETSTDDSISATFGGYLAYLDEDGRIWGVAPALSVGDTTTIALRAGLVWTL